MKEVLLSDRAHFKISELSGGMKRRLSVSISLVGDPKIIFLDEPSTGLDPENRRQLWDILAKCKGKRAMVLTTHSVTKFSFFLFIYCFFFLNNNRWKKQTFYAIESELSLMEHSGVLGSPFV